MAAQSLPDKSRLTVVCIAGGPSLTREDCEYAASRDCKIIGVNDAYRISPRLDVLYGSDYPWWRHHWDKVKDLPCLKVTQRHKQEYPDLPIFSLEGKHGSSLTDKMLNFGGNSGFAAVWLAFHLGAARVLLLGYDMKMGGKRHWFGDHPGKMNKKSHYENWVKSYNDAAGDLPIINCSRDTALTCFPRSTIQEVL